MAGGHLDSVAGGPGHQRQRQRRAQPCSRLPRRSARTRRARRSGWRSGQRRSSGCSARATTSRSLDRAERDRDRRLHEPRHGRLAECRAGRVLRRRRDLGASCCATPHGGHLGEVSSRRGVRPHVLRTSPASRWAVCTPARPRRARAESRATPATTWPATRSTTSTCRCFCGWRDARARGALGTSQIGRAQAKKKTSPRTRYSASSCTPSNQFDSPSGSPAWRSAPRT